MDRATRTQLIDLSITYEGRARAAARRASLARDPQVSLAWRDLANILGGLGVRYDLLVRGHDGIWRC